ncbi:MAG: 1-deoxy-D-xylulose-5-phosphate synthase [Deltaproteobacteria bacterium RIFCSPLOWO2_12_FULL_60_19]|nr:MAG: 1-deoxy-D-xylulose-5-phosphate synthase [Deltaproteobacteria bacterium RIFCSPLOWO2_12_FULL_60_19]
MTKLLDKIHEPADLRKLAVAELPALAQEVREEILSVVSEVGGHLASTLGAVELTLALHYAFNTPDDRIVWDTGHQGYAHKLICGRREKLPTLRQLGGLSGFLSREESEYDVFGAGHAGTSVSAALGMVVANALQGSKRKVVSVISDGGMTAGLTYEGLNQAGHLAKDLIVVLNDNAIFIDPRVGAFSSFLSKQLTTDLAVRLQKNLVHLLRTLPKVGENLYHLAHKFKESFIGLVTPGFLFEALGFQYVGPIDGYDLEEMIQTFQNVKKLEHPTLIHVITKKGKGYQPAEEDPIKYHSVTPFHVLTGKAKKAKSPIPTYTDVFAGALIRLAKENPKVVGITAAMGSGTGIDKLSRELPERSYDVGIAEQHAVTFAAGMATEGWVPVVAIYSTFLQRGYDEILHDVCLQNLHVVFALDRGGLVGADGPTHHGVFDFAYLRSIPNMVVMAPKDENELQQMLKTAIEHQGPIALRYPRGEGFGVELDGDIRALEIGKGELLRPGKDVAILGIGNTVIPALKAARDLAQLGIDAAVVNARFVKPLDRELLLSVVTQISRVITVEDHVMQGGFGSAVLELLADEGLTGVTVRRLGVPDRFIAHGTQDELKKICAIDKDAIAQAAIQMVRAEKKRKKEGWERGSA